MLWAWPAAGISVCPHAWGWGVIPPIKKAAAGPAGAPVQPCGLSSAGGRRAAKAWPGAPVRPGLRSWWCRSVLPGAVALSVRAVCAVGGRSCRFLGWAPAVSLLAPPQTPRPCRDGCVRAQQSHGPAHPSLSRCLVLGRPSCLARLRPASALWPQALGFLHLAECCFRWPSFAVVITYLLLCSSGVRQGNPC